jgi:hypothetical protein
VFDHLLDSRPARERRLLSWILAAIINAVVVALMIATNTPPQARRQSLPAPRAILPVNDQPIIVSRLERAPNRQTPNAQTLVTLQTSGAPPSTPTAAGGSEAPAATGKVAPESKSLGERLGGAHDARLRPGDPDVTSSSPLTEARLRIEHEIGRLNDSIATERANTEKARNWTKGEEGNRWGITPGKLHLGSKTLTLAGATNNAPVPDIIRPPPGRRDEVAARLQNWNEIQSQVARAEQRATFSERVDAIRARVESSRTRVATVKNK